MNHNGRLCECGGLNRGKRMGGTDLEYCGSGGWQLEMVLQIEPNCCIVLVSFFVKCTTRRCPVKTFIWRSGLLSITLVVLFGSLPAYGAPLAEQMELISSHTPSGIFEGCKDIGETVNFSKVAFWQENCRPTQLKEDRSLAKPRNFHHDLLSGDMVYPRNVKYDKSINCFGESMLGASGMVNNCISNGGFGVISLTNTPILSETIQSLYEFELPHMESRGRKSSEVVLAYNGSPHPRHLDSIVTDLNGFIQDGSVTPNVQLQALQQKEFKQLVFWEYDYQIQVLDTVTRFIPKTLSIRNVEIGDLLALLLLLLLLPDYKRFRILLGDVFVRKTLKC